MLRFAWLPAAFGVLLLTALVGAQGGGSAVQGRVIDAQQAVLPGVAIVVTHQENGTFRETITGPDGTYFVTGLPPGRYRIAADLPGFKKFVREDVTLLLGSTQTVELRLEVGGVAETVTVTEEAPAVDLTSARVGGNVALARAPELPSPTRNFIAFVAMVPGVQLNPSAEGSDSLSVNGQSNNQVNLRARRRQQHRRQLGVGLGRAGAHAARDGRGIPGTVTNQFDVEFGRTTGGVVNAITKRGTNAFRGSAFGYLTNSAMTAPNYPRRAGWRGRIGNRQTSVRRHLRWSHRPQQAAFLLQLRAVRRSAAPHQRVPNPAGSQLGRRSRG